MCLIMLSQCVSRLMQWVGMINAKFMKVPYLNCIMLCQLTKVLLFNLDQIQIAKGDLIRTAQMSRFISHDQAQWHNPGLRHDQGPARGWSTQPLSHRSVFSDRWCNLGYFAWIYNIQGKVVNLKRWKLPGGNIKFLHMAFILETLSGSCCACLQFAPNNCPTE